jgi:hypothetical protein
MDAKNPITLILFGFDDVDELDPLWGKLADAKIVRVFELPRPASLPVVYPAVIRVRLILK